MARTKTSKSTKKTSSSKGTKKKAASLFEDAGGPGDGAGAGGASGDGEEAVALHEAAQARYLNYSLSVITSRALPDVRDGLKPVQRRILYTMLRERMLPDAKPRKCAGVVGSALKDFHPHGDSALYDALVRMAQPWQMRHNLVDGHGNFGSIDGDSAAAYRYTECRLAPPALPLLDDIRNGTVPFRPNYDGTNEEPVVLPARYPNLLVNGGAGIAVGMATNIPPHNMAETLSACLKVLADPEVKDYQLVANDAVQGPDFPTGGQVIASREQLREIYKTGSGSIKIRGTCTVDRKLKTRSTKTMVISSVPYGVNKANLVEQIGQIVVQRKMALILDVRDLSAEDIRVELDLKKDADEQKVLAYLHKHTNLQVNYSYNLTCLVPTENPEVGAPSRLGLKEVLWHFLHFRLDVVTRRLRNELQGLEKRIHILEGFSLVFDALDDIIRIIRASSGKADAAKKILRKYKQLDEEQTDAILELKLYRLAKLEINLVLDELEAKRTRADEIRALLGEDDSDTTASGRWGIVREELQEVLKDLGKSKEAKRRTIVEAPTEEVEYSEEDFIVAEDTHLLVTRDGWVKRQKEIKEPTKSRIRDGDSVLACVAGSTRATVGFFSSAGTCYTARFADLPSSTGFGEPIQKLFKLKDGERIVAVISFDSRTLGGDINEDPKKPDACPMIHGFAATSDGYAMRFGLDKYQEPSTRSGRRFARPSAGKSVIGALKVHGSETILAVTERCRAIVCAAEEINYLGGPGKGVRLIKVAKDDALLGFKASRGDRDLLTVETNRGAQKNISTVKYRTTARGGVGNEIQKNGRIKQIIQDPVSAPTL
ncbi:MAG: DNA topoisomerase 4 subunit A [Planctomycetota bacterium]|nr:DNA topoisomerase 4 subunit A [Planctomycetota bacterium]MDG1984686.1 DNA topoisomerase 4 subunit A [Planctomycetota bacterium]